MGSHDAERVSDPDSGAVPPGLLSGFLPLSGLSEAHLQALAQATERLSARSGSRLVARGSSDDYAYLLIEGEVELIASDGKRHRVRAGTASGAAPLARLRPRHYEVVAATDVTYLRLPEVMVSARPTAREAMDVEALMSQSWYQRLLADLAAGRLLLPILPEVARGIQQALIDTVQADTPALVRLVQSDPVVAARLVQVARASTCLDRVRVGSCRDAVVCLGAQRTRTLLAGIATRGTYQVQSPLLRERLVATWSHSLDVAVGAAVLAREIGSIDPEHAALVGLLHDLGSFAILRYLDVDGPADLQPRLLDEALSALRVQTTAGLLRIWSFGRDFVVAALESEDLERNPQPELDPCDLVVAAHLDPLSQASNAPRCDDRLPVCNKLRGSIHGRMEGFLERLPLLKASTRKTMFQ